MDGLIKTDDLRHLREDELFVDAETGQKYRVRKTLLPAHSVGGPHGVGDPNDRSLRRVEADVLIPNMMNERIQRVECREPLQSSNLFCFTSCHNFHIKVSDLAECLKREGSFLGLRKCQNQLNRYEECQLALFNDPWFRQQITDEYVKERAEYRRTGKNEKERQWERYCEYKRRRGDWPEIASDSNSYAFLHLINHISGMMDVNWCHLCMVQLSSKSLLSVHNSGKRHQKKVEEYENLCALSARSIFISELDPELNVTESEISEALSCFGKVEQVRLDKKKGKFAIVEFDQEFAAQRAIFEDKVRIGRQVVPVRARKIDFDYSKLKRETHMLDIDKLKNHLNQFPTFEDQVYALLQLCCLSDAQCKEREDCAKILTEVLKDYFTSGMHVRIFGSSVTSLGIKNSDIDATLFFNKPLVKQYSAGDLERNKYMLMTCDISTIKARKICPEEYARLSPADRVRLLNKIINDIRKCSTAPIISQYPILNTRCPLVRFIFDRKHVVDLSVDNHLGYAKCDWLKHIAHSDSSQLIRKFLVSFRIWAHANGLLEAGEKERSYFNAYILNLLCITFLQLHDYIPPLQRSRQEMIVNEWRIDFVVDSVDLRFLSLKHLFREFFIWFVHLKLKDIILCPNIGTAVTFEQFRQLYPENNVRNTFKFAYLNIQDPLELSHNVSMLVSEKHVAMMRRQMQFALSRIKIKPDSFTALLCDIRGSESMSSSGYKLFTSLWMKQNSTVVRVKGYDIDKFLNFIDHIFVDLLAFVPAVGPIQKKPRFEYCHEVSGTCDPGDEIERIFVVKKCVWEGRRCVRRQMIRQHPELSSDAAALEKAVSDHI
ncbi:unnamed protein product [Thelazia callipaeda]|uniref:RRM domain-containing protein n=1 Tax=Thelazia callipaeda TaxID=103827 RepID=A0A0N5D3V3_THECL|nr:unnamed protein product [Thelazia callipaeda]